MKSIFIIITLLCVVSCSSSSYFVSLNSDSVSMEEISRLYGEGQYFYFYSQYEMKKNEINDSYESYYSFVEEKVKKESICNRKYVILKQSLSYYDENGKVSVLIKCDTIN